MKIISVADVGIKEAELQLTKKAFDEIELGASMRAKNQEVFGEDLTASELVHRIVRDVRSGGDQALLRYTKLLDGLDLNSKDIMVSESELQAAADQVDAAVLASLERAAKNIFAFDLSRPWIDPGAGSDSTLACWNLCSGRDGGVSVICAHERHTCHSRWR